MAASLAVPLNVVASSSQAYLEGKTVRDTRVSIFELCRHFYNLGWVSGTGGSMTIKVHDDDSIPKSKQLILMSPSGVQKERIEPEDMYVLSANGAVLCSPSPQPYPHKHPKCSDCGPLFMKNRARSLDWSTPNHGPLYNTKRYLSSYGSIDVSVKAGTADPNQNFEPSKRCIVLDIEGTTTPISFVTDVLFPYAHDNVGRHLSLKYDTAETQDDIKLLRSQVEEDLKNGIEGAIPIPPAEEGKEEVIAALVSNVNAMIKADRKIPALKQLQGHIWQTGFDNDELEGVVFDDVPEALEKWHSSGIKIYIYSSGSRLAQRLIFGKTNYGDLRKYLSGFFDTAVGNKRENRSYVEITESLGVDKASEILFVKDVYQEAIAAKAAGLEVVVSVRPGNSPLPENHGFKTVTSFLTI